MRAAVGSGLLGRAIAQTHPEEVGFRSLRVNTEHLVCPTNTRRRIELESERPNGSKLASCAPPVPERADRDDHKLPCFDCYRTGRRDLPGEGE